MRTYFRYIYFLLFSSLSICMASGTNNIDVILSNDNNVNDNNVNDNNVNDNNVNDNNANNNNANNNNSRQFTQFTPFEINQPSVLDRKKEEESIMTFKNVGITAIITLLLFGIYKYWPEKKSKKKKN